MPDGKLLEPELTKTLWSVPLHEILLGDAAKLSTWGADTIWHRSVRGVVNERVRHLDPENCTCEGVQLTPVLGGQR
jgi:hypothetical protein